MTTNINVTEQTTTVTTVDDVTTITLSNVGIQGATGVVAATAPITYNSGTQTVGINQAGLTLTQSQITNLVTDLANTAKLNVANAFTGNQAITGTVSGTAVASLQAASGQSVNILDILNSAGTGVGGFGNTGNLKVRTAIEFSAALNVAAASSGQIGAVIRGAASQSAVMQSWQLSDATEVTRVRSGGQIGIGSLITGTTFAVNTDLVGGAGSIGAIIRGAASQTANLQEWQNSGGTAYVAINNIGSLLWGSGSGSFLSGTNGRINVVLSDAASVGATVRGAASQSANLQEWQNSAGTVLARVASDGVIRATRYDTNNFKVLMGEEATGGFLTLLKPTGALSNPGAGAGRIYFRDGTTAGTLKLVVRAGAAGAEETLFDNLDQTGTSTIAIGSGVRATDATVATASTGVGYMGLPQNTTTTGAYTIVAADAGKHVYASATRTVTIPANSALALPIGTTLTFIAGVGATMTIAITTDTMYLAGAGTTGSRTLAAHGIATAVKTTATTWIISGNGLT